MKLRVRLVGIVMDNSIRVVAIASINIVTTAIFTVVGIFCAGLAVVSISIFDIGTSASVVFLARIAPVGVILGTGSTPARVIDPVPIIIFCGYPLTAFTDTHTL
jgi:hypothetical protein